jgi:hypothetical protein
MPNLNFKEKISNIRNVFRGKVAFLIDLEGLGNLLSSARSNEDTRYALSQIIPEILRYGSFILERDLELFMG